MRLRDLDDRIRTHMLVVPGLLVLVAIGLAFGLVELDRATGLEEVRGTRWIFRAGASGARDILTTIATSMVQLAGITFSVTVVTLALRSQQFGPHLLRNFTRSRLNQLVLGTFVATAVYALMVLRSVRDIDSAEAVDDETLIPLLSVTVAIVLAIMSLGLFVLFIHRIVEAIQANNVIAGVAEDTRKAIRRLFPEYLGRGGEGEEMRPEPPARCIRLEANRTGYVQHVDEELLLSTAVDADLVVWMEAPIGAFVSPGSLLAHVLAPGQPDEATCGRLSRSWIVGRNRTVDEDPAFGLRQIVDLAVKALSPSDNDPTTAVTALDHLGALLVDVAQRELPDRARKDDDGAVRVHAIGETFESLLDLVFDGVRPHLGGEPRVLDAALAALRRIAEATRTFSRRAAVERQLARLVRAADAAVSDRADRARIFEGIRSVSARLGGGAAARPSVEA